jgi:formamidase
MHNRWHPGIKPALRIAPGDTVEMQTRDALDGQIRASMTVADLPSLQLGRVHPLTGPIHVEGAMPGDLLAVHIEKIVADDHAFTATFPGRGFMPDLFPGPILVHWDLQDGFASSPQIPGVRIAGAPFMGTIGVAPSLERLRRVNAREKAVKDKGLLAMLPMVDGAIPPDPAIAEEAWRTSAAHEVGGNMDIRELVAGTTVYFPVDVPGALFSAGDGHFIQGDGETCGTAMEMSTRFTARFELLPGEARSRGQTNPTYELPAPSTPANGAKGYYATTALSVAADDTVSYLDASLAARNALSMMVDALCHDYGFTREQSYILASVVGA